MMSSKKIKRAVPAVYEDVKAKLKHQNLLQDYQELLKECDETRNKLEIAKQRKLILLNKVRFLRRRHKYLLETKSLNQPRDQPVNIENKRKLGRKEKIVNKKDTAQFKLPPLPDLKHKGRVYAGKEGAQKSATPILDLNRKVTSGTSKKTSSGLTQASDSNYRKRISSMKEAAVLNTGTAINLNQSETFEGGNGNGLGTRMPIFDLNQGTSFSAKEVALPTRAPIFDLNEVSMEEEEFQTNYEPPKFEEPNSGLMRAGNEEQPTDMKLSSICRNAGEGSSRMGKRKISWQDPVALRV